MADRSSKSAFGQAGGTVKNAGVAVKDARQAGAGQYLPSVPFERMLVMSSQAMGLTAGGFCAREKSP